MIWTKKCRNSVKDRKGCPSEGQLYFDLKQSWMKLKVVLEIGTCWEAGLGTWISEQKECWLGSKGAREGKWGREETSKPEHLCDIWGYGRICPLRRSRNLRPALTAALRTREFPPLPFLLQVPNWEGRRPPVDRTPPEIGVMASTWHLCEGWKSPQFSAHITHPKIYSAFSIDRKLVQLEVRWI
jgi:hypothetical protein